MQRPPANPQQAAMLDPLGLMSFPQPNRRRGLFGATVAGKPPFQIGVGGPNYGADDAAQLVGMTDAPPPIDAAPQPPANWQRTLGPEMMAVLPPVPNTDYQPLQPAPPMRAGMLGSPSRTPTTPPPGMFGATARNANIGSSLQRGAMNMGDSLGDAAPPKKGGFDFRMLAGIIGDGLLGLNGQPGVYGPAMWKRRQDEANHAQRLAEMREQTRLKLSEPDYATVNNRRVRIDPTTGKTEVLYTAPQDFEDYAATLGAEPGTPEFDRMVQDYVLRGSGPTATDNYNVREDYRQENREDLEDIRQGNRIGLQTHRQAGQRALKTTPTYRQANPLPPRSGGRSGGSSGGVREGQTATGPGGAKVVYRGGKWVPVK